MPEIFWRMADPPLLFTEEKSLIDTFPQLCDDFHLPQNPGRKFRIFVSIPSWHLSKTPSSSAYLRSMSITELPRTLT